MKERDTEREKEREREGDRERETTTVPCMCCIHHARLLCPLGLSKRERQVVFLGRLVICLADDQLSVFPYLTDGFLFLKTTHYDCKHILLL